MKSWKRPKQNQFLSKIWQVLAAILQLISATKVIVTKRCSIKKNTRWHMYSLEIKSLLQRAMLIRLPYVTASAWCLPVFMCVCAWKSFCLHLWYCAWRNWNSSLMRSQESEVVNLRGWPDWEDAWGNITTTWQKFLTCSLPVVYGVVQLLGNQMMSVCFNESVFGFV